MRGKSSNTAIGKIPNAVLVEGFRLKAEIAFAKKDWTKAEELFTSAIDNSDQVFNTTSRGSLRLGRLHSERSAARLRLNKFMEALEDANYAQREDPVEAVAFLREAEACSYLHAYERATNAYNKTADLEEDLIKSDRYRASALVTANLQNISTASRPGEDSKDFTFTLASNNTFQTNLIIPVTSFKLLDLLTESSNVLKIPNSVAWLVTLWKMFELGSIQCFGGDRDLENQACFTFTRAIITDSRSFHTAVAESLLEYSNNFMVYVKAQLALLELSAATFDRSSLIDEIYTTSWSGDEDDNYRRNVSIVLSNAFILAFLEEKKGCYGEAAIRYHLLEEACDLLLLPDSETDSISDSDSRENFPSPSGFSLPDNFTLGVRARRLDCSVKGHRMLFRDSEIVGGGAERLLPPFSLEEIRSESMSIMYDCEGTRDVLNYIEHATRSALAYSIRHMAAQEINLVKNGVARYMNPKLLKEAAEHYSEITGEKTKTGDPDARLALMSCLECYLFLGGEKVEKLLSEFEFAENLCPKELYQMLYGIPVKTSETYLFCRKICDQLKGLLAMGTITLETVLKPVPIVRRSDVPKKKNWKDMVDKGFYGNLIGDYSLVHWIK